jgi:hypothetical protein
MITYLVYTYAGDQDILESSVRLLRTLTSDSIVVVDDGHNPMSAEAYARLEAMACTIQVSTHHRMGNLIGQAHASYHAKKMLELAPGSDDIVVKFDPDTLILGLAWLDRFQKDTRAVLCGSFKAHINYVIGLAYAVKGSVLRAYAEDVELYPAWPKCFEDFEVSSRIYRLTGKDPHGILRYNLQPKSTWALCDYRTFDYTRIMGLQVWNGGFLYTPDKGVGRAPAYKAIVDRIIAEKQRARPSIAKPDPVTTPKSD